MNFCFSPKIPTSSGLSCNWSISLSLSLCQSHFGLDLTTNNCKDQHKDNNEKTSTFSLMYSCFSEFIYCFSEFLYMYKYSEKQ